MRRRPAAKPLGGLGTHASTLTPQVASAVARSREQRFARRGVSSRFLMADALELTGCETDAVKLAARPATCGWSAGGDVTVNRTASGAGRFGNVQQCASVHACPVCSATIRAGRAKEVQHAASWWEEQGKTFLLVTFTIRHRASDTLDRSLTALTDGYTRLINGAPWKRFAERYGVKHFVKSQETTWSALNGWHTHFHVLFFLDLEAAVEAALARFHAASASLDALLATSPTKPHKRARAAGQAAADALDEARWAALHGIGVDFKRRVHAWLAERWIACVVRSGGRAPSLERGVDVRAVRDGDVVALYISKVQDGDDAEVTGWGVGNELTRGDLKEKSNGKRNSITPFQLLDVEGLDDAQLERAAALWVEYVTGTLGRRATTWSRGLKDACGLLDRSDDELLIDLEAEDMEGHEVVALIAPRFWAMIRHDGAALARILRLVEEDRVHEIASVVPYKEPPLAQRSWVV